ncbi:uncharacterized protein [Henckelia pumila]|uniref:uncharacterized protein n=1 Tax=Henckelia pumila TaxID=405737 RepID=UPI003C6E9A95
MADGGNESHGSIGQGGGHQHRHHRHHHEDRHRPHKGRRRYTINKLLQIAPKPLLGSKNPEESRNLMFRIESAFRAFVCTKEQKMEGLEFVPDGRACLWWDSKADQARTERGRVTWEDFHQQFQKLYFPPAVRQARSMDFLMLRQGSMTIDEYQQRFIDLLSFSLHINESDASKYDIFLQVLNPDINSQVVVCEDPTSYETLVNRCHQVENSNRRAQLMMSG